MSYDDHLQRHIEKMAADEQRRIAEANAAAAALAARIQQARKVFTDFIRPEIHALAESLQRKLQLDSEIKESETTKHPRISIDIKRQFVKLDFHLDDNAEEISVDWRVQGFSGPSGRSLDPQKADAEQVKTIITAFLHKAFPAK